MNLIEQLKDAGQDFEFYPTTKEMVRTIFEHRRHPYSDGSGYSVDDFGNVLDIGCGTCNFKRFVDDLNKPLERPNDDYVDRSKCVSIKQYYVMEKSRILIDRLPADAIVLGVDFHENTLIDKPVDTIFCNPPYSEYEDWTVKIIRESACKEIYLIIPQRWKNSERIKAELDKLPKRYTRRSDYRDYEEPAQVIGSFDFLDAERAARAKVDIVYISKEHAAKDSGFNQFFDEIFDMSSKSDKFDFQSAEYQTEMKNELLTGRNKIEILCNGYAEAQRTLFEHFQAICSLDADILEVIGIKKQNVQEALKMKFKGLKTLYWNLAFDCLEEITSRLTSTSRDKIKSQFDKLLTVDFNASNVYALVIWVIKNANQYYKSQMVDFFLNMASPDNVQNYKSNQKVFARNQWGYNRRSHSHYTLDYRIVCSKSSLPGETQYRMYPTLKEQLDVKLQDVCTVANNLGFHIGETLYPEGYGQKGHCMLKDGTELFEFKLYMNGNVHLKFNKEFIKALNVEVSRELGWIHSREDIAREFEPEMAKGAEKYFDKTLKIALTNVPALMNSEM